MDSVRIYCYAALRNLYSVLSVIVVYTYCLCCDSANFSKDPAIHNLQISRHGQLISFRHIRQKTGVYMDSVRIYCYAALRNLYAIFSVIIIYTDFFRVCNFAHFRKDPAVHNLQISRHGQFVPLRHIRQKAGVYMDGVHIYCYAALRNLHAIFSVIVIYANFFCGNFSNFSKDPAIVNQNVSRHGQLISLRHIRQKTGVYMNGVRIYRYAALRNLYAIFSVIVIYANLFCSRYRANFCCRRFRSCTCFSDFQITCVYQFIPFRNFGQYRSIYIMIFRVCHHSFTANQMIAIFNIHIFNCYFNLRRCFQGSYVNDKL